MNKKERIHALQKALMFWLPNVPAEDSEREKRIAADAYLLAGYSGIFEAGAEDLGWIELTPYDEMIAHSEGREP